MSQHRKTERLSVPEADAMVRQASLTSYRPSIRYLAMVFGKSFGYWSACARLGTVDV